MNEFLQNITGGIPFGKFSAGFVIAAIGLTMSLLISATNRNPQSPRTPFKFSWSFLISDNMVRILRNGLLSLLVVFVSLRFVQQLAGTELTMFYCLGVGLFLDRSVRILKKKLAPDEEDKPQNIL